MITTLNLEPTIAEIRAEKSRVRREQSQKLREAQKRAFEAARSNRFTSDWNAPTTSVNAELRQGLRPQASGWHVSQDRSALIRVQQSVYFGDARAAVDLALRAALTRSLLLRPSSIARREQSCTCGSAILLCFHEPAHSPGSRKGSVGSGGLERSMRGHTPCSGRLSHRPPSAETGRERALHSGCVATSEYRAVRRRARAAQGRLTRTETRRGHRGAWRGQPHRPAPSLDARGAQVASARDDGRRTNVDQHVHPLSPMTSRLRRSEAEPAREGRSEGLLHDGDSGWNTGGEPRRSRVRRGPDDRCGQPVCGSDRAGGDTIQRSASASEGQPWTVRCAYSGWARRSAPSRRLPGPARIAKSSVADSVPSPPWA